MSTFHLTSGDDDFVGMAANDVFDAFLGASTTNPLSTLNAGDVINGGSGFNTLVLEGGSTSPGSPNTAIVGTITNIQSLVLIGSFVAANASKVPVYLDLSKIGGLQQVWLRDASAYGLAQPSGGFLANLANVSASLSVTFDSSTSAAAILNYLPTVVAAKVNLAAASVSGAEFSGAKLGAMTLNAEGAAGQIDLMFLAQDQYGASANLRTLTIDASAARAEIFNGDEGPLIAAILKVIYPGFTVSLPAGYNALTKVTVNGPGGGWVDLSGDKQAFTFTGGVGDDAVMVDPTTYDAASKCNGGGGVNTFALSLLNTPTSATTITPGAAGYAAINAAVNFQKVGFLGDFARPIVVDAALIKNQHVFIVGQTSRISNLTDADAIDFQLLNFAKLQSPHFRLDHAVDAQGRLIGAGLVSVQGGDFLGMAPLLKIFGGGTVGAIGGTAIFDSTSLYATLRLSGKMNAEIDSASTWLDSAGVAHGVTIDASKMVGDLKVVAATGLANTLIASAYDNILDGGAGADTINLSAGRNSSVDVVKAGAGDDLILAGGQFNAKDQIDGGAGADTLSLDGNYAAGVVFGAKTLVNVETIALAAGHAYHLTTNDATVAAGRTLDVNASALGSADALTFDGAAETNGHFDIHCGAGPATITGGALADTIIAGSGADTFVYASAAGSTSTHYDTLIGVNFAADRFDTPGPAGSITGVDAALRSGKLDAGVNFDAELATALNGHLTADHAILFTANAGTLAGQTFLVADLNKAAGYQAGADLVIHLAGQTGTFAASDFI